MIALAVTANATEVYLAPDVLVRVARTGLEKAALDAHPAEVVLVPIVRQVARRVSKSRLEYDDVPDVVRAMRDDDNYRRELSRIGMIQATAPYLPSKADARAAEERVNARTLHRKAGFVVYTDGIVTGASEHRVKAEADRGARKQLVIHTAHDPKREYRGWVRILRGPTPHSLKIKIKDADRKRAARLRAAALLLVADDLDVKVDGRLILPADKEASAQVREYLGHHFARQGYDYVVLR
jgi:hypothetical protein